MLYQPIDVDDGSVNFMLVNGSSAEMPSEKTLAMSSADS